MQYRQVIGKDIHGNSPVMRRLWDTKKVLQF